MRITGRREKAIKTQASLIAKQSTFPTARHVQGDHFRRLLRVCQALQGPRAFLKSSHGLNEPPYGTSGRTTHGQGAPTAMTKPQLATGPQKWVVLGPVGELMKAFSWGTRPPADLAAIASPGAHGR